MLTEYCCFTTVVQNFANQNYDSAKTIISLQQLKTFGCVKKRGKRNTCYAKHTILSVNYKNTRILSISKMCIRDRYNSCI